MLEPPDIPLESIVNCLEETYKLPVPEVSFLPLGADFNTAVYRVEDRWKTPYFLKLRQGKFDPTSVALPKFLYELGIPQIIPPLETADGRFWGRLDSYTTILYPFIEGHNGYEATLHEHHWAEFGSALNKIHRATIPGELLEGIRREDFSPRYRDSLRSFLLRIEQEVFDDAVASECASFLYMHREEVMDLVKRAEQLSLILASGPLEMIVCHSDLHAGNLFTGTDDALYIVDWDEPILAPKERDLMYIGGGLLASGRSADDEERLFYQGYGQTPHDPTALAYYRYERIIQDIAAYCEELLLTMVGGLDRQQSLSYLKSNFLPNNTIDIAYRSDMTGTNFAWLDRTIYQAPAS